MLHHFGTRMDVCDGQERSLASIAFGASLLCGAFDVFCGEEEDEGEDEQDDQQAQNTITYILRPGKNKKRMSKMISRKHNHIHPEAG